jgi:DNA-binding MarR family transcriptional regulator
MSASKLLGFLPRKHQDIHPAEKDMQRYFEVSPPSIHQMVLTLEKKELIKRIPGQARSISLLVPREQLPDLE